MSSVFERFVKSTPIRGKDVFIAKGAIVYGAVTLMDHSSIWFNAVLRADINQIIIGKYSNVQDNATFHTGASNSSILGDYVTVGHNAIVHGCKVCDGCMIGMGSILLDDAIIPEACLVGAGALVTPKLKAPPHSLIVGSPAKVIRELSQEEVDNLKKWAIEYSEVAQYHIKNKIGLGDLLISSQSNPQSELNEKK